MNKEDAKLVREFLDALDRTILAIDMELEFRRQDKENAGDDRREVRAWEQNHQ